VSNLTITIDDDLLRRARVRALQQGTSVNALLREYLEAFAGADSFAAARRRFVELARRSTSGGKGRRRWTRDELHER
jgi:plasmid stability protein